MNGRKRDHHFQFVMTQDEREKLKSLAREAGCTQAAWLRAKIRQKWKQLNLPGVVAT